jgi:hypothetical protein
MEITKYQWIKGDKIGNVEDIIDYGQEWITFKNGGRIASSLLNEFMVPIQWDNQVMDFSSQTEVPKQPQKITKREEKPQTSFLYDLIDNIKVKENHTTEFEINFKLPKKEMINVLVSSYAEEEVLLTLKEYVLNQIDMKSLHETIKSKFSDISIFL